jgi:hypothetical protein
MLRIMLVLALALAGCMGGEEVNGGGTQNTIRAGFYDQRQSLTLDGNFFELIVQARFSGDNSYTGSMYIGTIPVMEAKGKWAVAGNTLAYSSVTRREANEDGSWGPWQPGETSIDQVRNITATSFQTYFDFEKEFTAEERARFQGVSSGWQTFNRISD